MQNRINGAMARAVEQGIIIDALRGAANAWAYLTATQVPKSVMLRVLADPARRRPMDVEAVAMVSVNDLRYDSKVDAPSVLNSYLQSPDLMSRRA